MIALLALGAFAAVAPRTDAAATRQAVAALLAAAPVTIPASAPWPASSCRLEHGPHAPPQTVGGLVARQVGEFSSGRNTVTGGCGPGPACKVSLLHADGEDVSATAISFRLKGGRLDPASLLCEVTP